MNDQFLSALHDAPRPAFARELRERLRGLERTEVRKRSPLPAVAATLLLVAGSLAFPQMREAARAILDLFREHDVVAIRFDPARVAELRARIGGRSPLLVTFGEPELLNDPGPPVTYRTAQDAAAAGVLVRLPASPPEGMELVRVEVTGAVRERRSVDRDELHETIDSLDLEQVGVPRRLAEGSFELVRPRAVSLHYASGDRRLQLLETEAPGLTPSPGLELPLLGEIGLRVLGVEAVEAHRLAGTIDWAATLAVPMPAGASSFRELELRGRKGLLVSGEASRTLLWSEAGRLHALSGTPSGEELLRVAESLPL